jgi:HEAT repeat protein
MTPYPGRRRFWRRGRPRINRLARRGRVEELIAALSYTDLLTDREGGSIDAGAPLRREAVLALEKLGDPRGIRAIAEQGPYDRDDDVRQTALRSLVGHRDEQTVAALAGVAASGPYLQARELAVDVIRTIGSASVGSDVVTRMIAREGSEELHRDDVAIVSG